MNNTFFAAEFLAREFFGNTMREYFVALGVFVGLIVVFGIFQKVLLARLKKFAERTKTDFDDALIGIVQSVRPPFYSFLAFFLALQLLDIHSVTNKVVDAILVIWVVYQVIVAVQMFVDYAVRKKMKGEEERGTKSALTAVKTLTKVVLWTLGAIFILSNLGVDVTSLLAGLGIGGIAIAFALQNVLGDLFSSFAIYLDKPFVVGDVIVIKDKTGVVEKIGIKTTRLRALQGEEIVISNQELTSAHVQNFKKMKERRTSFSFGVVYDTPVKVLKEIPKMVEEIIASVELARIDRVHFTELGDSALNFEVVYYVNSPEVRDYRNVHQAILFQITEKFEKKGIEFAYPTQTLYVEKG